MAPAQILNERVATDHDARNAGLFQPTPRSQPRFESAVIGFDPVVIRYDMCGRFGRLPVRVLGSVGRVRGVPEE